MRLPLRHLRRRWRLATGVLLAPPLLWCAVLAVVPTECARRTIAARLSASSGRTVRLGGLRLGWLGQVSLHDLRIGAPDSGDDPWLTVRDASIDVHLGQLLLGRVEPREVDIDGMSLRVLRRADGTLELADLVATPRDGSGGGGGEAAERDLVCRLRNAEVTVIDEPTESRVRLTDVEGRATCKGRVASIPELTGTLNGGTLALAAQLDRSGDSPCYEGELKLRNVVLDEGMNALAYLVPVLAGSQTRVDGTLTLDLYARGRGDTRAAFRETLAGHADLTLDPVVLEGSKLLEAVGRLVELPPEGRTGSVRAGLTVRNGRIMTDDLTIDVARLPVVLTGWTDFDGRVDYRLRSDRLSDRLPPRAKEFLSELSLSVDEVADVHISGTVGALQVSLDGVTVGNAPAGRTASQRSEGRERLRDVGRRLLERVRR